MPKLRKTGGVPIGWAVRNGRDLDRYFARDDRDLEADRVTYSKHEAPGLRERQPRTPKLGTEGVHLWLETELGSVGVFLADALKTIRQGRKSPEVRVVRESLDVAVYKLRRKNVTLAVIGEAIGKNNTSTIENMEKRGRRVVERSSRVELASCSRHATFHADCPSCLRRHPEQAVEYTGPEQLRGRLVGTRNEA